jgi:hypothetical protein
MCDRFAVYLTGGPSAQKSEYDLVFSSKRPVVTEAKATRALVVEVE